MKTILTSTTPATGLSSAVRERLLVAPAPAAHGTGLSFAGRSAAPAAAQVAVVGARSTDLPGSPSRGAPV